MMHSNELIKFIKRRYKIDSRMAFICRIARFGLIGLHLPFSEAKMQGYRNSKEHYVVRNIQGSEMLLNPRDKGISSDLLSFGIREPLISSEFRRLLKCGMVCYDIGANIGYYALQEAMLVGQTGYVYAIEPIQTSGKILTLNRLLNGYPNMEVLSCAIGAEVGQGEINLSSMSNMCSMMKNKGYREYVKKIPVQVETVDHFMLDHRLPDVIRMDTEGYETEIIKGMDGLLKSGKPLILFIEIHFDVLMDKTKPMLQKLKDYGFKVKVASHETHPAILKSPLKPLIKLLEKGMGASGYVDATIDDLMNRRCFQSGQVENLEVIFERK